MEFTKERELIDFVEKMKYMVIYPDASSKLYKSLRDVNKIESYFINITVRGAEPCETSLWKLSAGLGPSFLETGWLARQFPRIHMAIGNSALNFSSVSWKPAGWLRRCGFQHSAPYCTEKNLRVL